MWPWTRRPASSRAPAASSACASAHPPLDEELFANLPEVRRVTRNGDTVIVTGTGNLVQVVASTLAQRQIIAHELRIEQAALDDAFIALTGEKV